jgi:hypothetical protein
MIDAFRQLALTNQKRSAQLRAGLFFCDEGYNVCMHAVVSENDRTSTDARKTVGIILAAILVTWRCPGCRRTRG